jgi:hypothetical protein
MRRRLSLALGAGAIVVLIAILVWRLASENRDSATPIDGRSAPASSIVEQPSLNAGTSGAEQRPRPVDAADSEAEVRAVDGEPDVPRGHSSSAPSAHFAGLAVDDVGVPLVNHAVEVYAPSPSGLEFGRLEARAVTNSEGRFWIDAIGSGPKRVVICGPGDGDIWDENPGIHGYHAQREERELMLGVPDAGLDDFVLRGVDHTGILVTARVVDDLGRPVQIWGFALTDEAGRWGSLSNFDGQLSGVVPVAADGEFELQQYFLSREKEADPLYRAHFMPLKVHLSRASDRIDLGTLVVTRMAGLKLRLADGENGSGIGGADVRLHCTGGGQPPADLRGEANKDGSYDLWTGRNSGEYELDVKATGYPPAHRVGVLIAGDAPVPLELTLEPK